MNATTMQQNRGYTLINCVSWSAILAGVVIGLILEMLLNLLGFGLGLTAFNADSDTLAKIGTGSMIWFAISSILALTAGGWTAGWFANTTCRFNGALHGLITWGLGTLLTFTLLASVAGALIGGTANLVGQGMSLAGKGMSLAGKGIMEVAPQVAETAKNTLTDEVNSPLNKVMQEAEQIIDHLQQQTNPSQAQQTLGTTSATQSPEQLRKQLQQTVTALFNADSENDKAAAKQKVIDFLSQNANMSATQAEQTVNNWEQSYEQMKAQLSQKAAQAKEQAKAAAEKAADIASSIALMTFFVLLLNAIAAFFGGFLGTRTNGKNINTTLPLQN